MLLLTAMKHKTALWILDVFCISSTDGIEALAGLIPFQLYFKKLVTACICLESIILTLVTTIRVKKKEEASRQRQSRDCR